MGQKPTFVAAIAHVRFTPKATSNATYGMSAKGQNGHDASIVVNKSQMRCGHGRCIPKWQLSVVVSVALGLLFHSFVPVLMCTCSNKPAPCARSALEFR